MIWLLYILISLVLGVVAGFFAYIFTISFIWDSTLKLAYEEDRAYRRSVENKAIVMASISFIATFIGFNIYLFTQ